jgi:hypothetical protein
VDNPKPKIYRWLANASVVLAIGSGLFCVLSAFGPASITNVLTFEFLISVLFPILLVLTIIGAIIGIVAMRKLGYQTRAGIGLMLNLILIILFALAMIVASIPAPLSAE